MTRINLTGGSYEARSPIAAAQRQLNLYSEPQPGDSSEPAPVANYQTPGLTLLGTLPTGPVRGIHCTSGDHFSGVSFIVAGVTVYWLSLTTNPLGFVVNSIGTIGSTLTPVSMADNGVSLVIVDGTTSGYVVDIATKVMSTIVDPAFYGANAVTYLDTYFIFNKIDPISTVATPVFYWSDSNAVTFNALNFASKTGYVDSIHSVIAAKRELWLIGDYTSEIWFDSGDPLAAFARVDGAFVDHGTMATYSVASIDNQVFWLSRNREGGGVVLQAGGYAANKISSFALDSAMSRYSRIADAIGWTYMIEGHVCYVLTFPTADKTWVYDLSTQKWQETCWLDPATGLEHAHRGRCAFVQQDTGSGGTTSIRPKTLVLVGDRINGNIYALDPLVHTDNGDPIKRQRAFPHIEGSDGERLFFRQFLANISVGTTTGAAPLLTLDWSDDRGLTWGTPITSTLGAAGAGLTSVQFQRLGMARSRVFRLTWTADAGIALLGAWVDVTKSAS